MALTTNLVSWWSLDQESDGTAPVTRLDSHGSNDLTDNGTTASAAGKVGNAGSFIIANTEYFSAGTSPDLKPATGSSWSLSAWANPGASITKALAGSYDGSGWAIDTSGGIRFFVIDSVGAKSATAPALANGVWSHVYAYYDDSVKEIGLSVNNAVATTTSVGVLVPSAIGTFLGDRSAGNIPWNGLIDEAAIFQGLLTAEERTFLYNGGAGRSYAEAVAFGASSFSRRGRLFRP